MVHLNDVSNANLEFKTPFIPDTRIQWAWDSTMLEDAKRCPKLYEYKYIQGWRPKGENANLRFGGEFHTCVQHYDMSRAHGIPHNDAVHDVVRELLHRTWGWEPDPETKAGKYKNRSSLIRTVINYLDYYYPDPAETYILENGKPAVELSFNYELDFGPKFSRDTVGQRPYTLCGHLDRIVVFNGDHFGMDYKTTTTTPSTYYFDTYSPHNQMSLYTLASNVIFKAPVKGMIINAVQMLIGSNRFVRGITFRTQDQIDEWLYDLEHWLLQMEGYALHQYWPRNDTACDKYGGCPFRTVCSKSPAVREIYLKADFTQEEPWNPLTPRTSSTLSTLVSNGSTD
jgi:hypothetical protein